MKETFYTVRAPLDARIALLADLHEDSGQDILASLRAQKPDLIAVAGDLIMVRRPEHTVYKMESVPQVLGLLAACTEIAPVFVSLGNHERLLCERDLEMIRSTGVTLLDDAYVQHGPFVIGGLTSFSRRDYQDVKKRWYPDALYPKSSNEKEALLPQPDVSWLNAFTKQEGFMILLSHHPEYYFLQYPFLADLPIDLVLSGHAHGGQVRLFRALFAPGQGLFPKYTEGVFAGPHGSLVITKGCGNSRSRGVPRLFNPPETVYIDLRK